MRKVRFSAVLVVFLVLIAALSAKPTEAHQTDTPHLDHYICYVSGADLVCQFYIHNPAWWGHHCPHNVESSYMYRVLPFADPQGCMIKAWFRPIPPQRTWFATLYIRDYGGALITQHGISWSVEQPATPTPPPPTPTPAPPSDPYFTGYTCNHWPTVTQCVAYMKVPEGYNEEYYGTIDTDYFMFGGSSWDPATRTWTLDMYFYPPPCGRFARLYCIETQTGRLLDELYLEKNCEQPITH